MRERLLQLIQIPRGSSSCCAVEDHFEPGGHHGGVLGVEAERGASGTLWQIVIPAAPLVCGQRRAFVQGAVSHQVVCDVQSPRLCHVTRRILLLSRDVLVLRGQKRAPVFCLFLLLDIKCSA